MKGLLQLSNGDYFQGKWLTANSTTKVEGEVAVYTGMTGYDEVLTDPFYKDKIVVFTYPLIGNYGISAEKFASEKPQVAAVIVYEAKQTAFHYEASYKLAEYLQKWDIPLLGHVDTRAVMKKIRQEGPLTASIINEKLQEAKKIIQATA